MIINKRITEAVQMLKSFDTRESMLYWLGKLDICESEKGFIYMYLGLNEVL